MMAPIVTLILSKVLDYLAAHADEIVAALKAEFLSGENPDADINAAVQELGYEPTAERLEKLHEILVDKKQDPDRLASILVTKTVV